MNCATLDLTLESIPARRTPDERNRFEYGVHLRIVGGVVLAEGDPLLAAFGARTTRLFVSDAAALQDEAFAAGREVSLEIEYDADGDSVVGIWDRDGLRRAGTLPHDPRCPMVAAMDHGLELRGVVVREQVSAANHTRCSLELLVYSPCFVTLSIPEDLVVERPERTVPQRVVLIADGSGEVSFWDPAAEAGPAAPDELPLSPSLAAELARLRERYVELAGDDDEEDGLFFGDWLRESLDRRAAILWRRARNELGRRFAVGFQGPGMAKPVWSPDELAKDDDDDEDDDVPF